MTDFELFNKYFYLNEGVLYNKVTRGSKAIKDTVAGGIHSKGYLKLGFLGKQYLVHRVIWLLNFGNWPIYEIDHINGDRTDNRINNLQDVTTADNGRNKKIPSTNSSGHIGVIWDSARNKWRSELQINGKKKTLGRFDSIEEAIEIRRIKQAEYGFHSNHGRN